MNKIIIALIGIFYKDIHLDDKMKPHVRRSAIASVYAIPIFIILSIIFLIISIKNKLPENKKENNSTITEASKIENIDTIPKVDLGQKATTVDTVHAKHHTISAAKSIRESTTAITTHTFTPINLPSPIGSNKIVASTSNTSLMANFVNTNLFGDVGISEGEANTIIAYIKKMEENKQVKITKAHITLMPGNTNLVYEVTTMLNNYGYDVPVSVYSIEDWSFYNNEMTSPVFNLNSNYKLRCEINDDGGLNIIVGETGEDDNLLIFK